MDGRPNLIDHHAEINIYWFHYSFCLIDFLSVELSLWILGSETEQSIEKLASWILVSWNPASNPGGRARIKWVLCFLIYWFFCIFWISDISVVLTFKEKDHKESDRKQYFWWLSVSFRLIFRCVLTRNSGLFLNSGFINDGNLDFFKGTKANKQVLLLPYWKSSSYKTRRKIVFFWKLIRFSLIFFAGSKGKFHERLNLINPVLVVLQQEELFISFAWETQPVTMIIQVLNF